MIVGTKISRSSPGCGAEPSVSVCIQLIATRKLTTSSPEMMPMKMDSTRKSRSSRVGAIFSMSICDICSGSTAGIVSGRDAVPVASFACAPVSAVLMCSVCSCYPLLLRTMP